MPPHLCPNSPHRDAPTGTMALCTHPTILSNLTPEQAFKSDTGILHASFLDAPTLTLQYWITTGSILPKFTQDIQEAGYDVLYFTFFSTEAAWTRLYPDQPVLNTVSVRRTKTAPPTFPTLTSPMSTLLTPENPPNHIYPSKPAVNPTTALIVLKQQTLQKNATIMVHMNARPSTLSALQPLSSRP